jgi:ribosome-binding protein aMBF1 (putative translation factor)
MELLLASIAADSAAAKAPTIGTDDRRETMRGAFDAPLASAFSLWDGGAMIDIAARLAFLRVCPPNGVNLRQLVTVRREQHASCQTREARPDARRRQHDLARRKVTGLASDRGRSRMSINGAQVKAGREMLGWSRRELCARSRVKIHEIAEFEEGARELSEGAIIHLRWALRSAGVEFTNEGESAARIKVADNNEPAGKLSDD